MNPMSSHWHSPLAHSLPYINSVSDSPPERGMIMSMGMSPAPYDDMNELQYPFEEEMASSTEYMESASVSSTGHIQSISTTAYHMRTSHTKVSTKQHRKQSSITSTTTTSSDDSDPEIDDIQHAIDRTLGFKEDETLLAAVDDETPRKINPRAKYLAQLGIGKKLPIAQIARKSPSSQTSSRVTPRTPPTSPVTDANDDSLDAMLALMGVSDEMTTTPHVMRSSPIDIPRRVTRPIPIPTRQSRPISRPVIPMIHHSSQQHKYDSDDDTESYFDSPQSEDLSGSMIFDY